ncbi:MAG: hypothetical protein U5R06_05815 [candidate division KSB1 bacterium]|nr:hypothetical protein [candidate division KSB1 bacterium]
MKTLLCIFMLLATCYSMDLLDQDFQISRISPENFKFGDLHTDASGKMLLTWVEAYRPTHSPSFYYALYGQRLSNSGVILTEPFEIEHDFTNVKSQYALSISNDGNFIVAWIKNSKVYIKRVNYDNSLYERDAVRIDAGFTKRATRDNIQVSINEQGFAVAVWETRNPAHELEGALIPPVPAPTANSFIISTDAVCPNVQLLPDSKFLTIWADGDLKGKIYDYSGNLTVIKNDFTIDSTPSSIPYPPLMDADNNGKTTILYQPFEDNYVNIKCCQLSANGGMATSPVYLEKNQYHVTDRLLGLDVGSSNSVVALWGSSLDHVLLTEQMNSHLDNIWGPVNIFHDITRDDMHGYAVPALGSNNDTWMLYSSGYSGMVLGRRNQNGYQTKPYVYTLRPGSDAAYPQTAMDKTTGYAAVTWHGHENGEIRVQLLSPEPDYIEENVNVCETNTGSHPDVGVGDHVVVVWEDHRDSQEQDIYLQSIELVGALSGGNVRVNDLGMSCEESFAAMNGDTALVVWENTNTGQITGQLFKSGSPLGGNFVISSDFDNASAACVAGSGNGRFAVAWQATHITPPFLVSSAVYGRVYDSKGDLIVDTFKVAGDSGNASQPKLDMDRDNNLMITWLDYRRDQFNASVYCRRYSNSGKPAGKEIRINADDTGKERVDIAVHPSGGGLLYWVTRSI